MKISKYITVFASIALLSCSAWAQNSSEEDLSTRVNPILEEGMLQKISHQKFSFIKYDKNHIIMNGQNWDKLKKSLAGITQGGQVNIVHIGDSHIQAEGSTSPIRQQLQAEYGDGGRGLIIPFRIAGTNQPLDYKIQSTGKFATATLMKTPWQVQPGFTGVGMRSLQQTFDITLQVKSPFTVIKPLAIGKWSVTQVKANGQSVHFTTGIVDGSEAIVLDKPQTNVTLTVNSSAIFAGFEVQNSNPGILYHALGNNGATFSTYLALSTLGTGIKQLSPDLVIISLGTNEAYGKFSESAFNTAMNRLVAEIRHNNPRAEILLTTPSETQRGTYTTATAKSAKKGRRGKKSRGRRVKSYLVNPNVATVRNLILKYGSEHRIAVYDWYDVAGGAGSSTKWLNERLLGNDRIHKTWSGYRVEGDLLFNALNEQLTKD